MTVGFLHIFTLHIHTRFDKFRGLFAYSYMDFLTDLIVFRDKYYAVILLSFLQLNTLILIQLTVCFYYENTDFRYSSQSINSGWL